MTKSWIVMLLCVFGLASTMPACGDDDDGEGSGDTDTDTDTDTDADSDTDTDADTDTDTDTDADTEDTDTFAEGDKDFGSACTCTGSGCTQLGVNVPIPTGGTLVGCDDVPTDVTGAALVCLRSYKGPFATNTYFSNGYCALMSTKCEGDKTICDNGTFGSYDEMTECPTGTVMLSSTQDVEVELVPGSAMNATIDNKSCIKACTADDECRAGEQDPKLSETSQYACVDKEGVKFCYDPRNLPDEYEATSF